MPNEWKDARSAASDRPPYQLQADAAAVRTAAAAMLRAKGWIADERDGCIYSNSIGASVWWPTLVAICAKDGAPGSSAVQIGAVREVPHVLARSYDEDELYSMLIAQLGRK
jgi:hypothetical protein